MTNQLKEKIKLVMRKFYIPWIILYFFIISVAVAFGASAYNKYDDHQLPSGYIELEVSKEKYELGETVEFILKNHFPTTIYVTNECPKEPLNVYRWVDEKWIELHDTAKDSGECYSESRNIAIPSEGSRKYNFSDWPNLFREPGVYRIATAIDHYNDVPFQDFVIMEPASVIEVKKIIPSPTPPALTPPPAQIAPEPTPEINIRVEDDEDEREERRNEREREEEDDD